MLRTTLTSAMLVLATCASPVRGQALGEPERFFPGDEIIQKYLLAESQKLGARLAGDLKSLDAWQSRRDAYHRQYLYMLGLEPLPERTPLSATVTGTIKGDGYTVELLHYQSRPRLYVTANLYRPAGAQPGERFPAVLYVCGHSGRGRDGNKVAYQSHGIWFARHGYVCLVVDSLQLGEIGATHHGTYNLERWWWHARGYTPAGVEAWNGIRGIDYLVSRDDVDPDRIAVTGISGGGAATFWVAAADERVRVAVPVSGMADLESYVPNRVINGHCDCMFLYNTFQWPWTRIAALVAPRPMLFVNSDQDRIFPMDANERVAARLERLYSLYGAGDRVDAVVSVGSHAYRPDIRQAAYRFIQTHLNGDSRAVLDSERDVVSEGRDPGPYPIAPERLRVFPADADLPADELNTTIDEHFVAVARVPRPDPASFPSWKKALVDELRRVSFGYFPESIPAGVPVEQVSAVAERIQSEPSIHVVLGYKPRAFGAPPEKVLLVVLNESESGTTPTWIDGVAELDEAVVLCEPRGIGATRWTRKNPPNYVERAHALLGRTVDAGRVWDVVSAARYLPDSDRLPGDQPLRVRVAGRGAAGIIAAYAAVLSDDIAGAVVIDPPPSHMAAGAPQFLNVLRVCDVPESLGLVAPRPLTLVGAAPDSWEATTAAYAAAGADKHLVFR